MIKNTQSKASLRYCKEVVEDLDDPLVDLSGRMTLKSLQSIEKASLGLKIHVDLVRQTHLLSYFQQLKQSEQPTFQTLPVIFCLDENDQALQHAIIFDIL